ncbi:MAG TPA: hypothetical protein EYN89_09930, partial [Flavobacteriales bacterium]|nr:hypothetical protein [Flavobacteriales bacterium]
MFFTYIRLSTKPPTIMKKLLLVLTLLISLTCLGQTPCDSLPKIEQGDQTICIGDSVELNIIPSGYSLEFDGVDDYVDLGNSADFDFSTSPLTVMCWVNVRGRDWYNAVVAKSNGSDHGWYIALQTDGGANDGEFVFSGVNPGDRFIVHSNDKFIYDKWYHVAAIHENGKQEFYLNGVLTDTDLTHSYDIFNTATNLLIGDNQNDNFDGFIDEVMLWDKVLTSQQIQQYMNCSPIGNESNLVGYWDFEEGSGTTTSDQTSNGNDGSLINGVNWSTNVPNIACYSTYDYTWSTGDTTTSITVSPSATTTYSVIVDDGITTCSDSVTVAVTNPQVNLGDTLSACGDSVLLDAGAGYNYYSWSTGESTQTIYATATGDYAATVGDAVPVSNDYSLSFDGVDDFLDLTPIDLSYSSAITLMCWINAADLVSDEWNNLIRQDWGEPNWLIQFYDFGTKLNFNIEDNTGTNFILNITVDPTTFENSWHHITATYDGSNQYLYIDGVLAGTGSVSGGNVAFGGNSQPIYHAIASHSYPGNYNETFDGKIDEFTIWDIALDSTQIQTYMNCPPTGNEAGLVGYWNLEEGSGSTAVDQTLNGNDGTIDGATWSTDVPATNGNNNVLWSTGDITSSITVSPSITTTYSVTVDNGITSCSDSVSVSVTDLGISFTTTDATCNGYADGTAAATITNGLGPYSFSWSTTATTSAISSLGPGTYSVSVTDSMGCSKTDSLTIAEPALLTASGVATDVLCYGDSNGSIDLTVSGGTAPY